MLALNIGTLVLGFLLGLFSAVFIGIWMFFYSRFEDRRKKKKMKKSDPNYIMQDHYGSSSDND